MDKNQKYYWGNGFQSEPGWVVRNGNGMTFIFFFAILIFVSNFPFNEVVTGKVIVTSKYPPVHIISKTEGRILKIDFQPGDVVFKGDVLGELENDANVEDVLGLKAKLNSGLNLRSLQELNETYPPNLILDTELQLAYNTFLSYYHHLILNESLNDQSVYDFQLRQELVNQLSSIENKVQELTIVNRNLEVSKANYNRFQELFNKGVISKVDLEKAEKEFLTEKSHVYSLSQDYNQLILENKEIESKLRLLNNSTLKTERNLNVDLLLSQKNLINAIKNWEETYILKSPIDGRLSYFEIWGEYQKIEKGESVFSVIPQNKKGLIGKCIIPVRNVGKLQKGQNANLKLDNFPYHEWGMVKAKVSSISQVPKGGENPGYIVYLAINDLKTSYGKELDFYQELNGTAEILLKEVTLLERIFYQLRHIWSNGNF